ncbi:MAG: hypothetical protein ACR2MP_34070 [Streptosporangiaceae bacterium]
MTGTLLQLLARARREGMSIDLDHDGTLRIQGPQSGGPLARALLARKPEVLTVTDIWNGRAEMLDWRHARVLEESRACGTCGSRTLLLDPWDDQPTHKTCAEALIRPTATATAGQAA